ncbi:class F sortase [Streptomyces sp. NBC_00234]|uniref:class F sortase n=1 Tax=Streptomyces sp. NBC_00234 TaxID=2903638 RepID=UPI002E2BB750|nr:class F sortase [Streptomyces sp. NBC_00234]
MPRTSPRFRRVAGPLPALAVCVALAGCSFASPEQAAPTPSATESAARPSPQEPHEPTEPTETAGRAKPPSTATAPAELSIPSVGVSSSLMRLGLNADGTVEVPPAEQGMTAGWYTGGAVPGAPGAAVLIGHNDTRFGKAVFHDLQDIRKGAVVVVRDTGGKAVRFTVTGTETVSKKAFPTERVYGATGRPTLRVITCDGAFDAEGHPVDNLIVYAELR